MQRRPRRSRRARTARSSSTAPPQELKSVSTLQTLTADTTGALTLLNGIAPGVGIDQRVGRQVQFVRIEGHVLSYVTPGTGADQVHRILVVVDRQPNAAAFAITDVLNTVSTISLPTLSGQKRFKILYDRSWNLNATSEAFSEKVFPLRLPMRLITQYNAGTAGTVADIATNSVYLVAIGSLAAGVTAGSVRFDGRIRYYDS